MSGISATPILTVALDPRDCLERLIKQDGKEVLLVAHSSGGWVATQAAIPEL